MLSYNEIQVILQAITFSVGLYDMSDEIIMWKETRAMLNAKIPLAA